MEARFDYKNDVGRINTRLMMKRNENKNFSIAEKEAVGQYFNTFSMYCENDVIQRFRKLQGKLAGQKLMFKFNGSKYAIFPMDQFDRVPITDYKLTLEELEDFAENA